METMTNEEKAKHLASREMYGGFTLAEQNAAYDAAMAMAEWKDEQFAQERQQLIDKACEWIKDNINSYLDWYDWGKCRVGKDELIDDFRKAMKG